MEDSLMGLGNTGIFLGFMLASIGVPIPLPLLLGLVYMAKQGYELTFATGVLLVFAGSFTGDVVAYFSFRYGGRPLLGHFLSGKASSIKKFGKIEDLYNRYGVLSLIMLRWISWGKAQIVWLCGMCNTNVVSFLMNLIIAELPWAFFWVFVIFKFTEYIRHLLI